MNGAYKKVADFIMQGQIEQLRAENEQLRASLDYVAMMTDIELPNMEEADNAQPEIR